MIERLPALVLLFLAPDLSIAAFAAGPRAGAVVCNAVHTTVWPLALGAIGVVGGSHLQRV